MTYVANNGETVMVAENYSTEQSAKNAIDSVKAGAAYATVEDKTGESSYSSRW